MTASVSGFSIILGMCSALDTLLPSAWTSPRPELVGLWSQRMSASLMTSIFNFEVKGYHSCPAVRVLDCTSPTSVLCLRTDAHLADIACLAERRTYPPCPKTRTSGGAPGCNLP